MESPRVTIIMDQIRTCLWAERRVFQLFQQWGLEGDTHSSTRPHIHTLGPQPCWPWPTQYCVLAKDSGILRPRNLLETLLFAVNTFHVEEVEWGLSYLCDSASIQKNKKNKNGWYLCKIFNIAHMAWNECVGGRADKCQNLRSYLTAEPVRLIEMRKKKQAVRICPGMAAGLPVATFQCPSCHKARQSRLLMHKTQELLKEKQHTLYRAWLQPACQGRALILSLCTQSSFRTPL